MHRQIQFVVICFSLKSLPFLLKVLFMTQRSKYKLVTHPSEIIHRHMQCSDVKGKRSHVGLKWCDTISKKKKKKIKTTICRNWHFIQLITSPPVQHIPGLQQFAANCKWNSSHHNNAICSEHICNAVIWCTDECRNNNRIIVKCGWDRGTIHPVTRHCGINMVLELLKLLAERVT